MQIAFHVGVHCTDDGRLLRCLQANADALAAEGIAVPDPDIYRNLLRDAASTLQGQAASAETEAIMIEQIMDEQQADRIILSWDSFLAYPTWAVRGRFYSKAGERVRGLQNTFPSHETQIYMAIRNPATFLPDLCSRKRNRPVSEIIGDVDPLDLYWSEVVNDLRSLVPHAPLTVWCDEDTPMIWPEVLAAVAGVEDGTALAGWDDILHHVMEDEGVRRLQTIMSETPVPDLARRRDMIGNLLSEFVRPEVVEAEFEMPGWTQGLVDEMTARYEADIERIQQTPGVTFLTP